MVGTGTSLTGPGWNKTEENETRRGEDKRGQIGIRGQGEAEQNQVR
jgi:hypothetical protein